MTDKKYKAIIFGLGLNSISPHYQQHPDIRLVATGGAGSHILKAKYIQNLNTSIVVGIGYCGGLQYYLKKGDLILPSEAVDGGPNVELQNRNSIENYLNNAEKHRFKPDAELSLALFDKMTKEYYNVHPGKVFQVEHPKIETDEFVRHLHERMYAGVDMESATLLSLAEEFGQKAAVVLMVSDMQWPIDAREKLSFDDGLPAHSFYPLLRKVINALESVI